MNRIIVLCILFLLNEKDVMAAPVLTVDTTIRRGNLEIDLREANSVLTVSSLEKANEIFNFFDEKIFPLVPTSLLEKISKRSIKIEFQKDLKKGALFLDTPKEDQPLLLLVRATLVNDPKFFHLIAHEWFHALHYVIHRDEPAWMREGLAQVFEFMVFNVFNPNIRAALENTTTPLSYAFNIDEQNLEAYGHVYLYFYYLYEKCGKRELFWRMVESRSEKFAEHSIDLALSSIVSKPQYCSDFKSSLIHAELARFHNRKVKSVDGSTDEYLITPTLNSSVKNVLSAQDVALVIPSLRKYEPRIFQASALKNLKKFILSNEWVVFSLGQSTPYSVTPGLAVNPAASPPDVIFVMKVSE